MWLSVLRKKPETIKDLIRKEVLVKIMIQFQLSEAERTVLVQRVNEGIQHLCFIWAENIKANMGKKHKNDKCMVQRIKKQQLCEKRITSNDPNNFDYFDVFFKIVSGATT